MSPTFRLASIAILGVLSSCGKEPTSEMMNKDLSMQGLDPSGEYFIFELADRIATKVDIDDTPASVERLQALPERWRYIEPLIYYYNEVNNGGHRQYFGNSNGVYRHLVAEGLKYYQAGEFALNYSEALAIYNSKTAHEKQGSVTAVQAADKEDWYDEPDTRFYRIHPKLAEVVSAFLLKNPEQYK